MNEQVKRLCDVDEKTGTLSTDKVLLVEEEEIKKINIDTFFNNSTKIKNMENTLSTKIDTVENKANQNETDINLLRLSLGSYSTQIEDNKNDIAKMKNMSHRLYNLLKESKHFCTTAWTINDSVNCVLSDGFLNTGTVKNLSYYKCTKNYTSYRQNVNLISGRKYTFSYYVYGSKSGIKVRPFWSNIDGDNPSGQSLNGDEITCTGNGWERHQVVIDVVGNFTACIRVEPTNLEDGDYIFLGGFTLLEGEAYDIGHIENPEDQNWKFLSSGTDIVKQPDGKYCGANLYHAPPTSYTDVPFYYEMTTYGRNSKYKKLHAWNATYNIEYVATMNNGNWTNWSVVHKEDEVYNFNLTSAPSTNIINISSLYCNNSIDLHFIASGVTGGNGNPTCSFYFWYDDNGTNKQGNIAFQLPVNVDNSNKAPVSLKVKLVKMNDNAWMVNLDCIRNGNGYNTFSKCTLVTGTNIKIKTCNISTNNQNIKFETPCLILRYN